MEIIKMDKRTQESKKQQYLLSKNPNIMKLSDAAEKTINVCGYMFYSDTKAGSDSSKLILTLADVDETVYGTDSKTAQENFSDILEFFEEDLEECGAIPITVKTSLSKNNRTFVTLVYAG